MSEKAGHTAAFSWFFRSNPMVHWRLGALITALSIGILIIWSIDGSIVNNLVLRSYRPDYLTSKVDSSPPENLTPPSISSSPTNITPKTDDLNHNLAPSISSSLTNITPITTNDLAPSITPSLTKLTQQTSNVTDVGIPSPSPKTQPISPVTSESEFVPYVESVSVQSTNETNNNQNLTQQNASSPSSSSVVVDWISAELEQNLTSNLLEQWIMPGGEPCKDSLTTKIAIPHLDTASKSTVELRTGEIHDIVFHALDESGNPRCSGGDYFEIDISGEKWKSRPPVKDFNNGSYSLKLQIHPDFAGDYTLSVILLFRHFQGLKFSPTRFAFDKQLRKIPITFTESDLKLPELKTCTKPDFGKEVWSGRWTRHARNDSCPISDDGRYRCFAPNFPCTQPWCEGSLGLLESNGWVYSSHCSFKLFTGDSAWDCLKGRWIFFWGDSNHVDSVRNLLFFVLAIQELQVVTRRFDMNFTNPKDPTQSIRITSVFNGHWDDSHNYLGIESLRNQGFRDLLKGYFVGETIPDTMIMNSGLHDGVYWPNIKRFAQGADYTAAFWKEVLDGVKNRGLKKPDFIYRTTVATGGYARLLAFNPAKMEAMNEILLDKMRAAGILSGVIDGFDLTFPWHYDNRHNDGVHYGRFPAKLKWRDGEIGHQYFVDLMVVQIWLNVLCSR